MATAYLGVSVLLFILARQVHQFCQVSDKKYRPAPVEISRPVQNRCERIPASPDSSECITSKLRQICGAGLSLTVLEFLPAGVRIETEHRPQIHFRDSTSARGSVRSLIVHGLIGIRFTTIPRVYTCDRGERTCRF